MVKEKLENNYNDLPYRKGVGLMIINSENKIFIGKRIDSVIEGWQMPQGGIDEGETPSEAAMREMKEEIGTNKGNILAVAKSWYNYDLPPSLIFAAFDGKFKGQTQKWFLIKFTGIDQDIKLDNHDPEFIEWKWVDIEKLMELIIPFKKSLYQKVVAEFQNLLQ